MDIWPDRNDPIHEAVFRRIFIPWLQKEIDKWVVRHNTSPKRADKNKILPHARPALIFEAPEEFESHDFKVSAQIG